VLLSVLLVISFVNYRQKQKASAEIQNKKGCWKKSKRKYMTVLFMPAEFREV
jgi:hypothetical protein